MTDKEKVKALFDTLSLVSNGIKRGYIDDQTIIGPRGSLTPLSKIINKTLVKAAP